MRPASSAAVVLSVLARRYFGSAGSLSAAIRAFAVAAPNVDHHSWAIHSGCECFSAACLGVASGSLATISSPFARGAPEHRVDQARTLRSVALGQLDRLPHRRVRGDAVEEGQLEDPEAQGGQQRRIQFRRRSAGKTFDDVIERGHALDGAVAELGGQREIGGSRRKRLASPCRARSAHASCSNTRRTTA